MKVEVAVESSGGCLGLPVSNSPCSLCGQSNTEVELTEELRSCVKVEVAVESRGGCLGLPVPNSPYGLCGRKAKLNSNCYRSQWNNK